MSKERIYISGKITGLDLGEAERNFSKAKEELLKSCDCEVVNPMEEIPYEKGKTWQEYMIDDIKLLFGCTSIFMLKNWHESKGARIECDIAKGMGINIMFEDSGS